MNSQWQQYRLAIVVALAVALPLLWYFLLYGPQLQSGQEVEAELQSVQQEFTDVQARLALASKLAVEKEKAEKHWHTLTDCLYPADSAELLLQHLSKTAATYNIALLDKQLEFEPLLGKLGARTPLGQIESVPLTLTGRGRYVDIGEFVAGLDREIVVAGIDQLGLTYAAAADPEIYFEMSLRVYVLTAPWSVS